MSIDQKQSFNIRFMEKEDLQKVGVIIDSTELFPSELLEGMTENYFKQADSAEIWMIASLGDALAAVVYCAPERLTSGTFNLYLIAVGKEVQGLGIGKRMMGHLEQMLKDKGERVLLVETSGLEEFERTRRFYDQCGYRREAVIRDFYRSGEDKVVFWKSLQNLK